VTAFDQYAVEAFERDAVDYLLKPVTDERLAQTIEKLRRGPATTQPDVDSLLELLTQRLEQTQADRLRWIRASKRIDGNEIIEQIPVDSVLYFQADDKYTCVVTREGEALIRVALSELASQLAPDTFVQIHRSVIVNLNSVSGTRRDLAGKLYVRIRHHARELPVARQYAGLFRQM
jgi:DNA-binding LytR/AlgR family response regulator